jgi:ankyrin repeat protein
MYLISNYIYNINNIWNNLKNKSLLKVKQINHIISQKYVIIVYQGYFNIMKYLENKEFDINIKDNYGNNGYLIACANGQIEVMEYLEKKGININMKDNYDCNAYLVACVNG